MAGVEVHEAFVAPGAPTGRVPLAARLLPASRFYGWYVAAACAVLLFVSVGIGYYGLSLFQRPLQDAHGWSNAAVSGATGLYFVSVGLTGAFSGPRIDRYGPLRFATAGVVMIATAIALIGALQELWQLYVVYAVMASGYGLCALSASTLMARWFVHRRARAMSIAFTGTSVGGMILAPVGSALIDSGGLELAGPVLGLTVLAVGLPVVLAVLARDPADLGLLPDGGQVPPRTARSSLTDAVQRRVWTRRQAVGTFGFWVILVSFLLAMTAQTGFLVHQLAFLEDRLGSRSTAAFALSTTALGSTVARLVVGSFADNIDKRIMTVVLFVVQATAVLAVVVVDNTVVTYALVLVIGFTVGNIFMMQSLMVSELFGMVSFGTISGTISMVVQIGSGLGPFVVGWAEDQTGSYTLPFTVTAAMTFAAAAVVTLARAPAPGPDAPTAAPVVT